MNVEQAIADRLESLNLIYERIEHEPFFTVEETLGAYERLGIPENKSLFLRDEKKRRFFLVVLEGTKRANLKDLAHRFDEKRLSFCSPVTLEAKLHTYPGAVSPFGLVFPEAEGIEVLVDTDLLSGEFVGFHPNVNTQTWKLKTADFKKFLDTLSHPVSFDSV